MAGVCADAEAGVVLMHSRGDVADMATFAHADYGDDVVGEVIARARRARRRARAARESTASASSLDPGIGFSKRAEHSLRVLARAARASPRSGFPVLVGVSRKRFIGEITRRDGARAIGSRNGRRERRRARSRRRAHLSRARRAADARRALDVAWAILQRAGAA